MIFKHLEQRRNLTVRAQRLDKFKENQEQALSLPKGILASFLRIAELIEELGPDLGRPHTAPLGQGLFEIRAKGKEGIARSVFCTVKDQ